MTTAGRARVIVADDHPRVLEATASLLAEKFEVVASAADGQAAIDAAARLRPDVVVLDIAMPGLDGFQTAARIGAVQPATRIVFLSNHVGDDFVLAGLSRGALAFVAKSRMQLDLVDAVGHACAGRAFVPSAGVLPRWPRPAGRRHDLQIYATDAFLIGAVVAFFESALEAGDSLVAVVSEPHRQALETQFDARGVNARALAAAGRYMVVDAQSALDGILLNGMPDRDLYEAAMEPLVERALAASIASPPHVSMFGEIAPILCANGAFDAMARLERIGSEYLASRPISLLCAYSTACFAADAHVPARICAEHSTIVPADPIP